MFEKHNYISDHMSIIVYIVWREEKCHNGVEVYEDDRAYRIEDCMLTRHISA